MLNQLGNRFIQALDNQFHRGSNLHLAAGHCFAYELRFLLQVLYKFVNLREGVSLLRGLGDNVIHVLLEFACQCGALAVNLI